MTNTFRAILSVIIVLAIAGAVYVFSAKKATGPTDGTVCTMEALLCPGGDYVSHTGPQCAFSPCQGTSFIGTLSQDSSGFWLLMDAPKNGTNEVTYKMPLTIKISNALKDLVGRRVQIYGNFTTGNQFNVDHLVELAGDAGNANLGQVGVGQSVLVNGVRVTLNKIVSDSRCPAGMYCIQAGSLVANVSLQSDTDKVTTNISSVQNPYGFDSFKVSIATVSPLRTASVTINASDYKITFRVETTAVSGPGELMGNVTLGPTCPVQRIPPDPQCADKPYQTTVQVKAPNKGTILYSQTTDAQGNFDFSLPAGTYDVSATGGTILPRCASQTVTISSGSATDITLMCDTGIR